MEGDLWIFRGVERFGGVLGGLWQSSGGFPYNRTSKSHLQEIIQEVLQEEAESGFWRFEGGKMVGKGE